MESRNDTLLSILIPVYNEEKTLPEIARLLSAVNWPIATEWIFIDDGSTDGSLVVLTHLKSHYPQVRIYRQPKNQGKSAALAVAIEVAKGDIITVQDADTEYDPQDLPKLVAPILEGKTDIVYGSRFRSDTAQVHRTLHRLVNQWLTFLSNFCSGIWLTDMESCYKVFRAPILKSFHLRSRRFGFEPEVTAYIAKFRYRISELPISYFPRSYAQGKKIGWRDGVAALWFIFKFNFLVSTAGCLKDRNGSVTGTTNDTRSNAA